MINCLKSEFVKLKNSHALYLVVILSLIEISTIPPYLFVTHNPVIIENMIFLPMIVYSTFIAIISISLYEQELIANQFQNIMGEQKKVRIWTSKLFAIDLLLLFPSLLLWGIVGVQLNRINDFLFVGIVTWLLLVLLNHFHMMMTFCIGKGSNLLISFVECLFLVFATNKAFLGRLWMPVALPVNAILDVGKKSVFETILALLCWILVFSIGNLVLVKTIKR